MKAGKVLNFNSLRGIGTISGDDGKEYFVHFSKIVGKQEKLLLKGEKVSFEVVTKDRDGRNDRAINIRVLDEGPPEKQVIFQNPFSPRSPINDPEKFAGRKQEIKTGAIGLVNKSNVLVTGPRGIGKSSYANQLLYIAQGKNYLLEKCNIELDEPLEYATISIRSLKGVSLKEIAGNIIRQFVKEFDLERKLNLEHQFDFQVYKLKAKFATKEVEQENTLDHFNYDLVKICDILDRKNGLLILIDEVENIDPDIGLPNFIKNVTEYFNTEKINVTFIITGIPCAITTLFFEHPSFVRLFMPVTLKELSQIESYELIDLFMTEQRKKITVDTKILITRIARGYPVNLQLIGFYAYQLSTNKFIAKEDVWRACDYIIDNVKTNEFLGKHEGVGFGLCDRILRYVVSDDYQKRSITFKNLSEFFSDCTREDLEEALIKLSDSEIIDTVTKGNYFIKDGLFQRYLQKYYRSESISN